MFAARILSKIRPQRQCACLLRSRLSPKWLSTKVDTDHLSEKQEKDAMKQAPGAMSSKYQVFRDEDSEEILDIFEESNKYGDLLETDKGEEDDPFAGINLERGTEGVYDIEDLVAVLRGENAQDIFVASVPTTIKYVDYMCVVTCKSVKHMKAVAGFVRRVYRKKMDSTDLIPKIEGANSKDWLALDLGNIALHIFSPKARRLYDLDSLWSVGPKYDSECNKQDPVAEMLEKHSIYLQDLQPAK